MNKLIACFLMTISVGLFAENKTSHLETIVLGSGCFWGAEKGYESLVGVYDAVSGYSDGYGIRPSYREITKFKNKFNDNNYAEVVEVTFNPERISYKDLVKKFFEIHDPTQMNRQGPDVGDQYRSVIFFHGDEQEKEAKEIFSEIEDSGEFANPIVTDITPVETFYEAEEYHQQYLEKKGVNVCH